MKRILLFVLAACGLASAQQNLGPANLAGLLYASNFAQWTVAQGDQGSYSWSNSDICKVHSAGATFYAFTVGVPVQIIDTGNPGHNEVVTPSRVNIGTSGCEIAVAPTYVHNSFYFQSASAGLNEALVFAGQQKYEIWLTPDWTRIGGTTGNITSATGNTNVTVMDARTAVLVPYTWGGSAYASTTFGGGGSLPTATAIGQVPTSTAAGTTYTAQTPLGGTTWFYPVEWYGAVGDWNGTTGTDNTTAIQNCLNAAAAAGGGQCLLQAKAYKITSALSITASAVGISGVSYGPSITVGDGQFVANVSASTLVSTSQTADILDVAGSGGGTGQTIGGNRFNDFTVMRSVIPTIGGLSSGIKFSYTGYIVVNHVWSQDSIYCFNFLGTGATLTGSIENSGALWGFNGFAAPSTVVGFYMNGASGSGSLRIRHSGAFANPSEVSSSGTTAYGMSIAGAHINDVMVDNFETGFMNIGEQVDCVSPSGATDCSDIHLNNVINDSFYQYGIEVQNLTSANGSTIEITGGWESTQVSSTTGIFVTASTGVTIEGVEFYNIAAGSGGMQYGVVGSASSRLAIVGNDFLGMVVSSVYLSTVSNSTVTGNIISGTSAAGNAQTMIDGISLTRSVVSANALGGYATTGVSLDSGSSHVVVNGLLSIDPTHITTATSDSGTGDVLSDGGSGGTCGTANIPCTNTGNTYTSEQTFSPASGPGILMTGGAPMNWAAAGSGDGWQIANSSGADLYSFQDTTNSVLAFIINSAAFGGLGEAIGASIPANGYYQWNNNNSGAGTNDTFLGRSGSGALKLGTTAGGSDGTLSAAAFVRAGTTFSVTGCGTATSLSGGATAGQFTGGSSTCSPVITMGGVTAPHGFACFIQDQTTSTAVFRQTASSTTTCTFTGSGTIGATDVLVFGAEPF